MNYSYPSRLLVIRIFLGFFCFSKCNTSMSAGLIISNFLLISLIYTDNLIDNRFNWKEPYIYPVGVIL